MKISLCIIAKNEEKVIGRCIDNIKNYVNEIIVVDTGSIDRTIEICKSKGAKVYNFTWNNNFSNAKNYALKKATGKWIIFLDADEYIKKSDMKLVLKRIEYADKNGYEALLCKCINLNEDDNSIKSIGSIIRIFKKSKNIKYIGRIHENIKNIKEDLKFIDTTDEINVFHTGYTDSVMKEKKKMDRNISLLYEELKDNPNSGNIHFYLVESLMIGEKYKEAYAHCNKVIELDNNTIIGSKSIIYNHKMKLMALLGYNEKEIEDIYNEAIKYDNTYPDYDWIMGMCYGDIGDNKKALEFYEKCCEKINKFNSKIECWSINKVKEIYIDLAKLYIVNDRKNESIKILMQLLNIYRNDDEVLGILISILREYENIESIIEFLKKLYDFKNEKDILIIMRACKNINDVILFQIVNEYVK